MHLFNASSMFNENAIKELLADINDPDKSRNKLIEVKKMLLKTYRLKVYGLPEDYTTTSYLVATNHLTDSDAPLIMSFDYDMMHKVKTTYPQMFVFAKENCFNGTSIPIELAPLLDMEKVVAVDRNSAGGSIGAIKEAVKWYSEGEQPKHYLIFPQGTIYDINKDCIDDIERGVFWLAKLIGIPVLPAFLEQAVEGEENRLIFGEPFTIPKDCREFDEYKTLWLQRVTSAQNNLEKLTGTPARKVELDEEHQVRKRFKHFD